MGLDNTIYAMSNINAILGSTLGYVNAKQNGVPTGYALSDMGYNLMNGAIRNAVSRDIQQHTGSYLGYAVNSLAGYGNPVANYKGTIGTIGAALLSSPPCNPFFMTSALYGCGPMGTGYWNTGFFGGSCCNPLGFGFGPSCFSPMGFYC